MTELQQARTNQGRRASDPQPEDIGKPLAARVAGHHRHAILILDVNGIVRFAATRGMFGHADEELLDRHLQSLIPSVPLRSNTPGFNVAYVRLAFAERSWHRHRARIGGRSIGPVELSVRALSIGRSYALLAAIREVRPTDCTSGGSAWGNVLQRERRYSS